MFNTLLYLIPLMKPLVFITLITFIVYITITFPLKGKPSDHVTTSSILQSAPPDNAHGVIFGKEKGAVFFSPVRLLHPGPGPGSFGRVSAAACRAGAAPQLRSALPPDADALHHRPCHGAGGGELLPAPLGGVFPVLGAARHLLP